MIQYQDVDTLAAQEKSPVMKLSVDDLLMISGINERSE
jgi:hypothetical protein